MNNRVSSWSLFRLVVLGIMTAGLVSLGGGAWAASAGDVAANLETRGLFMTLLLIFGGGLAVSLTPCVYPMIPITLSIIGARSAESKPLVGFARSLVFVLGIAVVYTVLGLVVALSGSTVGFLQQNRWFMGGISIVFMIMGLGMLGLFNLQLPPSVAAKLQGSGGRGGFVGAFLLGMTTGVVASPCGSPVLVGVITVAAAQGQAMLGAVMLFTYALGMGMLFLVLGAFPAFLNRMPKSGVWMEDVKKLLGIVLIIASFYYLQSAVPKLVAWGMLIATSLILALMIAVKSGERSNRPGLLWMWRLAGLVLVGVAIYGSLVLVPGVLKADERIVTDLKDKVKKLEAGAAPGVAVSAAPDAPTSGTKAAGTSAKLPPSEWLADEKAAVELAKANGWPMIIDFGAEWCAACKELEHDTFPVEGVQKALAGFVKVRIDCTEETEENVALQKKYGSVSLPTVVFINAAGEHLKDLTLLEFEKPEAFIERVNKVK